MNEMFRKLAHRVSHLVGTSWAFIIAILIIVGWGTTGPIFHFSDTWQLVINTGTTIITFLMVFLIQNTQNRQDTAIQIKLDELLKGVKGARTSLVDIEDISDEELDRLHKQFERLHRVEEKHDKAKREVSKKDAPASSSKPKKACAVVRAAGDWSNRFRFPALTIRVAHVSFEMLSRHHFCQEGRT